MSLEPSVELDTAIRAWFTSHERIVSMQTWVERLQAFCWRASEEVPSLAICVSRIASEDATPDEIVACLGQSRAFERMRDAPEHRLCLMRQNGRTVLVEVDAAI